MFGVDLGLNTASIICIGDSLRLIDHVVLNSDGKKDKPDWGRIVEMAEYICEEIYNVEKRLRSAGKVVEMDVALEEPIFSQRTFNPRSPVVLANIYAIVRYKLSKRGYRVFSINPQSAKATAKNMTKGRINNKADGKLRRILIDKMGKLTKYGMIEAFKIVTGNEPPHHTKYGRETLADSFFIAKTALDRKRAGING